MVNLFQLLVWAGGLCLLLLSTKSFFFFAVANVKQQSAVSSSAETQHSRSSASPGHGPFQYPKSHKLIEKLHPAPKDSHIELLFGLRQRNIPEAEKLLKEVSDPNSGSYGKYKTLEYWKENHSPTPESTETVLEFLRTNFPNRTIYFALSRDFVKMNCTVKEVEDVFLTSVEIYGHRLYDSDSAIRVSRPLQFPENVKEIVEFVNLAAPIHMYTKSTQRVKADLRLENIKEFSLQNGHPGVSRSPSSSSGSRPAHDHHSKSYQEDGERTEVRHLTEKSEELPSGKLGSFHFGYPTAVSRTRGLAPIIDPTSLTASDGAVRFSFMPYCMNNKANSRKYDRIGRGICDGQYRTLPYPTRTPYKERHDLYSQHATSPEEDEGLSGNAERKLEDENIGPEGNDNGDIPEGMPETISAAYKLMKNKNSLTGKCLSDTCIVGFEVIVMQPETSATKVVELPSLSPVLDAREAQCGNGYRCVELNTTIGGIENYAQTWIAIRSKYGDGTVSRFSPFTEVSPVWPLPDITPATLMELYGIPPNLPIRHSRNILSVAEFLEQYYSQKDLDAFFNLTGTPKQSPPVIVGPNNQISGAKNGTEAQLDIQYIMALASNVTTWFWSVPGRNEHTHQEPFLQWLFEINDLPDGRGPLVHSVSYGDDEESMEVWYAKRLNIEFLKMGLRGMSVLVASGDDGASGTLARTNMTYCGTSRPELPAAMPYVTTVGGTQLTRNSAPVCGMETTRVSIKCKYDKEKACMSDTGGGITTGGGFSNFFERPWYQVDQVHHYLHYSDHPLPGASFFNQNGRAYPDLSAYANNYVVLMDGKFQLVHGTSASTPVVAAMVAHWNDIRMSHGLPSLGFLNPLLYSIATEHPEAFHDILVGNNKCGVNAFKCCKDGFSASRGWDAVTGLGTPRFQRIAELIRDMSRRELARKMQQTGDAAEMSQIWGDENPAIEKAGGVNTRMQSWAESMEDNKTFWLTVAVLSVVFITVFAVQAWRGCGFKRRGTRRPPSTFEGDVRSGGIVSDVLLPRGNEGQNFQSRDVEGFDVPSANASVFN